MNKSFRWLVIGALVVSLTASGCSWFGGGKKKKDGSGLSEEDLNAQRDSRFGNSSIPSAEGEGMFRDIHFDYDSSAISDEARQDIESNVQVLQQNPGLKIVLEGHCDERGTEEYNMTLGASRARAVRDILVSYGIPSSKLETISYGENVPLAQGRDEASFAKNRRVHFSGYGKK